MRFVQTALILILTAGLLSADSIKDDLKKAKELENHGKYKEAVLIYKIIGKSDNYYLLEIDLKTGRHHQIRAQLSAIGCPIKGDLKYGYPRSNKDGSISLHARSVEFIHPVKKENINIVAPTPVDGLWDMFLED